MDFVLVLVDEIYRVAHIASIDDGESVRIGKCFLRTSDDDVTFSQNGIFTGFSITGEDHRQGDILPVFREFERRIYAVYFDAIRPLLSLGRRNRDEHERIRKDFVAVVIDQDHIFLAVRLVRHTEAQR